MIKMEKERLYEIANEIGLDEENLNERVQKTYLRLCGEKGGGKELALLYSFMEIELRLPEHIIQQTYLKSLDELDEKLDEKSKFLKEKTGIKPKISEDIIQNKYKDLFEKDRIDLLEYFINLFEIKPKIPEEIVQKKYKIMIQDDVSKESLEAIMNLTSIGLSEEIVQEKYKNIFETFRKIEQKQGIKSMDFYFDDFLKLEYDSLMRNLTNLYDATGIKPSEDVVQDKVYKHIFKEGNLFYQMASSFNLEMWNKMEGSFGIKPSEDVVQQAYLSLIETIEKEEEQKLDKFEDLRRLRDKTKIKPSEDVVQKVYNSSIPKTLCTSFTNSLVKFLEGIKIKPPKKFTQEIVKKYLEGETREAILGGDPLLQYSSIHDLQELGIDLSKAVIKKVKESFTQYLKEGNFYAIMDLEKMSGIEPSKEVYKEFLNCLG